MPHPFTCASEVPTAELSASFAAPCYKAMQHTASSNLSEPCKQLHSLQPRQETCARTHIHTEASLLKGPLTFRIKGLLELEKHFQHCMVTTGDH